MVVPYVVFWCVIYMLKLQQLECRAVRKGKCTKNLECGSLEDWTKIHELYTIFHFLTVLFFLLLYRSA